MATRKPKARAKLAFYHSRLPSPDFIRLIALLPSLELQDPLEVTLSEVRLDDVSDKENSYEALSYVWGARTGSEPIQCDGKVLLVTPNCESALRHLRLNDKARTLWIDAICIDQEDIPPSTEERNVQVAIMGKIYQKAVVTLCWFGEGNDLTDGLMAHLRRIGKCPSQRELKKYLRFEGMYSPFEPDHHPNMTVEKLREEGHLDFDTSAFSSLISHSWHSRIWTVQEASFSQNCQVVCGQSVIPWDTYVAAAHFLMFEEFMEQFNLQEQKKLHRTRHTKHSS